MRAGKKEGGHVHGPVHAPTAAARGTALPEARLAPGAGLAYPEPENRPAVRFLGRRTGRRWRMRHVHAAIQPERMRPVTRSVRLDGYVTSIRLEACFWSLLDAMATAEGLSTPKFLSRLHDEVLELHGEVRNFASFLRVACAVHLERHRPSPIGAAPRDPVARRSWH
jgi:predicted DNA-binding ribbon-helix-helix protein